MTDLPEAATAGRGETLANAEPPDLLALADAHLLRDRLRKAEELLGELATREPRREVLLRLMTTRLCNGRVAEAAPLAPFVLDAVPFEDAAMLVADLWMTARRCALAGLGAEASFAAARAAEVLDRHDVLATLQDARLTDGLFADSQDGEGHWTLRLLGELARRKTDPGYVIRFVAGLGGVRPSLSGRSRMEQLKAAARTALGDPACTPSLRDGAALMLLVAQDPEAAVAAGRGAAPESLAAAVGADAAAWLATSAELRQAAGRVAPRDEPPFIVLHRGGQDYVALCAASLAATNGARNVVLLGDATTATIGIGRYEAISDYSVAAERFAPSFHHYSVTEPAYGLFSFQRWLVVEEFCRVNRIDQCVVIDSDALGFSAASEIIAAMPPGAAMNDWTWTTTVRDARALGALADCMRDVYARPREELLELLESLGRTVAGRATRSFQDMHMFYCFRDSNPGLVVSQYKLPHHGGLDQAAAMDNGVEVGVPDELVLAVPGRPLKRPFLLGDRLHFRDAATGQMVRYHTVHCQGPSKAALHHYAALLLPGAEDSLRRWRAAPQPKPPQPKAPQPKATKPAAAPARQQLPNLRLPEHAALRDRLRAAVAALAPFDVAITPRLRGGTECAAGKSLPIEVKVRNAGAVPLPVLFEDMEVLRLGIEIIAETPHGLRLMVQSRLTLPVAALEPGAETTAVGTAPTALLVPGRYSVRCDLVFDHVRWMTKDARTRIAAPFAITGEMTKLPPEAPAAFRPHVASLNPDATSGIEAAGADRFRVHRSADSLLVRSQMHEHEIALLHMLAERALEGRGEIVDLGPLLGVGTCAMARGLAGNPHQAARSRRIWSYDLWQLGAVRSFLGAEVAGGDDTSLLPLFEATNADHIDRIRPNRGDLLTQSWDGAPIELLFVDCAKSDALMQHIAGTFYPSLVPGAWVVHQDFVHPDCWFIHVATGLMLDHLDYLYSVPWSSSVFRLRHALPAGWSLPPRQSLSLAEQRAAIGRVRDLMRPGAERMMMDLVEANCLLHHRMAEEASRLVAGVQPGSCKPDDAFRRLLTSTKARVQRLLPTGGTERKADA